MYLRVKAWTDFCASRLGGISVHHAPNVRAMLSRWPLVSVVARAATSSATRARKALDARPQYIADASSASGCAITFPQSRKQSCVMQGASRPATAVCPGRRILYDDVRQLGRSGGDREAPSTYLRPAATEGEAARGQ